MNAFEDSFSESDASNSDEELQEAFLAGKLLPGLNVVEDKKTFVNDIKGLKLKHKEFTLDLPWIERLECINKLAPLAPELASHMQEQEKKRENQLKNNKKLPQFAPAEDPVLNDFKREILFQRQAQAAILEAIPKLKEMGIQTIRPDDYFAEMAKTDVHMQKIKDKLIQRQAQQQRSERVKHLRMQKKEGKALQVQARLERQKEKRDMLNQVKKVKKGLSKDMSFLDDKKLLGKRKTKNKIYGFGGKKRGLKVNTKDSAADITEYRKPGKSGRPGQNKPSGKPKRLGKNRRIKGKKGKK